MLDSTHRSIEPVGIVGYPESRGATAQSRHRRRTTLVAVASLLVCVVAGSARSEARQQPDTLEDDIKAVFLFNFTKFIDWPETAFYGPSDTFRICALSDPAFSALLDATLKGETARGRTLQLVRPQPDQIPRCHILFIGRGEATRAAKMLPLAQGRPILTVGEVPNFLDAGGAINFVVENGRVRFDVDLPAAQRAGLVISSKLLRVARSVRESSQ